MEQRVGQLEQNIVDLTRQLTDAAHTIQQQQQQIHDVNAAAVAAVAAAGAGGGQGGGGQVVKLKRYDHSAPEKHKRTVAFLRYLTHVRHAAHANQWNLQRTIDSVISSMDGVATDTVKTMRREAAAYNDDFNTFYTQLSKKFVSSNFENVAKSQFLQRKQESDETIEQFHGQLCTLYEVAFSRLDEPWRYEADADPPDPWQANDPIGFRSRRLIEAFVSGLRNYKIKENYRLAVSIAGTPDTYDDCLERVMSLEGNYEQNAYESNLNKKHSGPGPGKAAGGPEPMDIGALQKRIGELEKKYGQRGRVGAASGGARSDKYCPYHKVTTHDGRECRVLKKKQQEGGSEGKGPGGNNPKQPSTGGSSSGSQPRNQGYRQGPGQGPGQGRVQCRVCSGWGHISSSCPSPRPKKAAGVVDTAGQSNDEHEAEHGHDSDQDSQWEFDPKNG